MTFAQPRDVSYARDETRPPCLVPPDWAELRAERGTPGPAAAHGHSRVLLSSGPESAKIAREFTTATLHNWDLDELATDAVIIATELVTNAIRHGTCCCTDGAGNGQVELAWQRDASRVICVVTDGSPKPPMLAPGDLESESGRGLYVVQALAASWGWVKLGAAEKAVWASLSLASAGASGLAARPAPARIWTGTVVRPQAG